MRVLVVTDNRSAVCPEHSQMNA